MELASRVPDDDVPVEGPAVKARRKLLFRELKEKWEAQRPEIPTVVTSLTDDLHEDDTAPEDRDNTADRFVPVEPTAPMDYLAVARQLASGNKEPWVKLLLPLEALTRHPFKPGPPGVSVAGPSQGQLIPRINAFSITPIGGVPNSPALAEARQRRLSCCTLQFLN